MRCDQDAVKRAEAAEDCAARTPDSAGAFGRSAVRRAHSAVRPEGYAERSYESPQRAAKSPHEFDRRPSRCAKPAQDSDGSAECFFRSAVRARVDAERSA